MQAAHLAQMAHLTQMAASVMAHLTQIPIGASVANCAPEQVARLTQVFPMARPTQLTVLTQVAYALHNEGSSWPAADAVSYRWRFSRKEILSKWRI